MVKLPKGQWTKRNMDYQATAKYIRRSTRKLRLVADSVRSLAPSEAILHLERMMKQSAEPLADVVKSAVANAKQKQIESGALRFKTIEIMGGPSMKRWRAVSRGQAHAYKKRMTHIRVVLTDEGKSAQSTVHSDQKTG